MENQSWLFWDGPRSAFLGTRANMARTDVWWSAGAFLGGRNNPETLALPKPAAVVGACCLEDPNRLDVTAGCLFWLTPKLLKPSRMPWVGVVGRESDSWLLIVMTLFWLWLVPGVRTSSWFPAFEINSWLLFSFSWLLTQIISSWLLPTCTSWLS